MQGKRSMIIRRLIIRNRADSTKKTREISSKKEVQIKIEITINQVELDKTNEILLKGSVNKKDLLRIIKSMKRKAAQSTIPRTNLLRLEVTKDNKTKPSNLHIKDNSPHTKDSRTLNKLSPKLGTKKLRTNSAINNK